MSFETASSGSASGSWQPEGERHERGCAAGITNGAARCQCATPVPAQPDTADEALAGVILGVARTGLPGRMVGKEMRDNCRVVARAVLAAGYVPPADMAHWEAVWRAEGAEQCERELVDDGLLCDCDDYDTVHISHQRLRRYAESAVEKERERIAAAIEAQAYPFHNLGYNAIWKAGVDSSASLARQEPTSAEGGDDGE